MMAATAMIASQSLKDNLPTAGPGHNTRALVPAGHVHGLLATAQMDKAKVAATVGASYTQIVTCRSLTMEYSGPLITMGMQNLTKAQTVVGEIVASALPSWFSDGSSDSDETACRRGVERRKGERYRGSRAGEGRRDDFGLDNQVHSRAHGCRISVRGALRSLPIIILVQSYTSNR
jgi:hypothetical protein